MAHRRFRRGRLLRAARTTFVAAAIGLAVTACDSAPPAAPPTTTTTASSTTKPPAITLDIPPTGSGTAAPAAGRRTPPASSAPRTTTAAVQPLRFPGTRPFVEFVSYDRATGWFSFRALVRHVNTDVQDHFTADPADTATHRLKLAPTAEVHGVDALCGGQARCTASQIAASPARGPFAVQLVVDAGNRVVGVYEQVGVIG